MIDVVMSEFGVYEPFLVALLCIIFAYVAGGGGKCDAKAKGLEKWFPILTLVVLVLFLAIRLDVARDKQKTHQPPMPVKYHIRELGPQQVTPDKQNWT